MLVKCYVGVVAMGDKGISTGYTNAEWILHCLARCAEIYGEAVIVHQYMPFVMSKVRALDFFHENKQKMNAIGWLCRECLTPANQVASFSVRANKFA